MSNQLITPRLREGETELERAFILLTEPATKRQLLTATERENRALVKECRRLIASIEKTRRDASRATLASKAI